MRALFASAARALRGFARGFLGLRTPLPRDPEALCAHHRERARGRTPCC
jgi:hypothetical protein